MGAGMAGLAAAYELLARRPDLEVVVFEAASRPGGKLRAVEIAGVRVDVGAESMLARRPEALELAAAVGLGDRLVHPATTQATVYSRGRLHALPSGTLMGVPARAADASGLLRPGEVARADRETEHLGRPLDHDVSVGDFVAARVGEAVVDRLVEPLLGGVYAGRARLLSLQATVPALWEAGRRGTTIAGAGGNARSETAQGATAEAARANDGAASPVFAGIRGGVAALADAVAGEVLRRGARLRTGCVVREMRRTAQGWTLVTGPAPAPEVHAVDAVVLAVPAAAARRLLAHHAPQAERALAETAYASLAIVTLALPRDGLAPLGGSGLLIPPVEDRLVKAATFTGHKWAWIAEARPEVMLLRASIGRFGQERDLQRDDAELVAAARSDLSAVLGVWLPAPIDTHVQRWGGGLPQYAVGHLNRVALVRSDVGRLPGVAVAGAAYDGVGIPACIASGRRAARDVLTHLGARAGAGGTMAS